jgi:hypothetical protein
MIPKLLEPLLGSENFLFKTYDVRAVAGTRFSTTALFDRRDQRSSFLRNAIPKPGRFGYCICDCSARGFLDERDPAFIGFTITLH